MRSEKLENHAAAIALHLSVTSGYFETVRARLLQGRFFHASDTTATEPVIVVNDMLARRYFGPDAAGRRLAATRSAPARGPRPCTRWPMSGEPAMTTISLK